MIRAFMFVAIAAAGVMAGAAGVYAADPIYSGRQRQDENGYDRRQKVRATYTYGRAEVCGELLIKYRHPYEPRSEVVRLCHPPIF